MVAQGALLLNNHVYQLRTNQNNSPQVDSLRCLTTDPNVATGPLVREDFFTVVVGCPCPGDFSGDALRNTADLIILLADFGLSGSCPPVLRADLNADNAVNTLDLTAFLAAFGVPCSFSCTLADWQPYLGSGESGRPGASISSKPTRAECDGTSTQSMAVTPTPPGPVLAALGFSSAEAFQSYVDTLTPEELKAYLVLVVAVAQNLDAGTP